MKRFVRNVYNGAFGFGLLIVNPITCSAEDVDNLLLATINCNVQSFLTSNAIVQQDSLSIFTEGFICGAVINAAKNLILHPLETVKTRQDTGMRGSALLDNVYSGIVPSLAGGIPAAAVFFGVKDVCRAVLTSQLYVDGKVATVLAVTLAQFPYWALRNPSEVIKTRIRTGSTNDTLLEMFSKGVKISDLYVGLLPNLLYALPSDWLKFVAYDVIAVSVLGVTEGQSLVGWEAAIGGALASLVAEIVCTTLDVVRTRVMVLKEV